MTMLDRMRRHKAWLKWSLAIVVLAFILLYVPQFMGTTGAGAAPSDVIATVEGRRVTAGRFQLLYNQQVAQMRAAYGEVNDDMLRQFGLSQRLMQQLVNQEAQLAEAQRLGITVTDGELRERLLRWPAFQENGHFVGEARYREMLNLARPPIRPSDFEQDLRESLVTEKLIAAVTGWIRVSDTDIEQEYRRRNEKVKLDLAVFSADQFRAGIEPTDAEIATYFTSHQETYRVPEKRRVRFLSIDAEPLRAKTAVTAAEIESRYQQNVQQYTTPDQLRASHILFKTEGKDEAAVRKVAESVLARIKAGGDFAALAKQYSEDDGSKINGGDLDFFGRGSMVKEFEDAAWALEPNQTSDIVKSEFGFHIIRVTGKRPASTRSLADVRPQLEEQIRLEKAQAEATRIADDLAKEIDDPSDLDRVAAARGLTVRDSGLFSREEPLGGGLGFSPAVASEAFSMDTGKVSGLLRTNQGYAFITLVEVKPSALPGLQDVRPRLRDDVIRVKSIEVARTKAAAFVQAARTNFAGAAKAAGAAIKSTDFVARGSTYPDVGVSEKLDTVVFSLPTGGVSQPVPTETAVVVAHVTNRQDIVTSELDAQRENLRTQITDERRNEFFGAYMQKARDKMSIEYNDAVVQTLLGRN